MTASPTAPQRTGFQTLSEKKKGGGEPPPLRWTGERIPPYRGAPPVGTGGTTTFFGGFFASWSRRYFTPASRLGSSPRATLSGASMTSMSGETPSASTAHCPSGVRKRKVGTVRVPPSTSGGLPERPARPPQVRVPISGPSFASRKKYGKASPPEPAWPLMSATLGPVL